MIPRYSRPEMTAIWSEESKFQIWFEIEAHACDAQGKLGVIPAEAAASIWQRGAFEIDRINEIERETKHDVIAFLTNLAEHIGENARFVHQGMTSSDILDTTLSVQLARATDLIMAGLDRLLTGLKKKGVRTQAYCNYWPQPWHSCRTNNAWAEICKFLCRVQTLS